MVVALVALVAGSEGNPGSTDAGTGKESCHVHCSFTPVWLPASGGQFGVTIHGTQTNPGSNGGADLRGIKIETRQYDLENVQGPWHVLGMLG